MKRFVVRTFVFLLAVAGFAGGVVAFVTCLDGRAYRAALVAPAGVDVIVCGDSQTATGLNPALFPRLWNKSATASPCEISFLRLQDSLMANPGRIRYVLIDVSQVHIGMDDRTQPLCFDGHVDDNTQLALWHLLEFPRKLGSAAGIFTGLYLHRLDKYRSALRHGKTCETPMCGGFLPSDAAGFLHQREAVLADLKMKAVPTAAMDPTERCVFWFQKMAELAQANGARPVFLTTPLHPEFQKAMAIRRRDSIPAVAASLARAFDAPYFNYLEMKLSDDCWKDCNHLNVRGASVLTRRLRADIESLENPS